MRPFSLILALCLAGCASGPRPILSAPPPAVSSGAIADCLARKGAHLYGASWCHWCHVQLRLFGPAAGRVPYVDCNPDKTLRLAPVCAAQGFTEESRFPIWIFKDGSRLYGVRDPAVLAAVAGCPLP